MESVAVFFPGRNLRPCWVIMHTIGAPPPSSRRGLVQAALVERDDCSHRGSCPCATHADLSVPSFSEWSHHRFDQRCLSSGSAQSEQAAADGGGRTGLLRFTRLQSGAGG